MKKILFFGFIVLFSLSACVPDFLNPDSPAEEVDIVTTVEAEANTQVAQTFEALNTPTIIAFSTNTKEATATIAPTETKIPTATDAATATTEATETPTGTLATETASTTPDGTLPAETETLTVTETSIYPPPTSPISINEPPDSVPRHKITVINKTKGKVYISLQGVTEGDYHPIIEYDIPAHGKAKFKIPEGKYAAIVYVGKDPMIAYFRIRSDNITIIIKRDQIQIEK